MPQELAVAPEIEFVSPEMDSLAEARSEVRSRIPPGRFVLAERVISDGALKTIRASGDTTDDAYGEAERQLPPGATVVSRKEIQASRRRTVAVAAPDEAVARGLMYGQLGRDEHVGTVSQIAPGTSGFLGIGRKLPQWQGEARAAAQAEIAFKRPAQLAVRVGERPGDWEGLLNALKALSGAPDTAGRQLETALPYQCLFALLVQKMGQPSYFAAIPFAPVTGKAVETARRYVENTKLPGMLGFGGGRLPPNRYRMTSTGGIGKIISAETAVSDGAIATTSSCVPRRTIPRSDYEAIGRTAWGAIQHYAEIPVVRYCFSLPYIATVLESRKLDPKQALMTVYQGTESLLLRIWDELPGGGLITDEGVVRKALAILSAD